MKKKIWSVLTAAVLALSSGAPLGAGDIGEAVFSSEDEGEDDGSVSEDDRNEWTEEAVVPEFPFMIFDGTNGDLITGAEEEDQELVEEIEDGRIFAIAPIPAEELAQAPENAMLTVGSEAAPVALAPGQYVIHNGEYASCDEVWTLEATHQGKCMSTTYRYVEYLDSSGAEHRSPLYCMNAQKAGLNPGQGGMTLKDAAYRFMTNSSLKKILYFGYGGPGNICGKYDPTCEHVDWSKWMNRFFYTHMALSIEYGADYNGASAEEVRHIGLTAFMDKLKSLTIPSRTSVKLRGKDPSGNVVTSDALRVPASLHMSKPEGWSWLEKRFDRGFQKTGLLIVQDEGGAGNGIRMSKPAGAEYQLIYWSSSEEYKSLGMDNPHVLGESQEVIMRTGYRFCLIFPKKLNKAVSITYTMLLYPVQFLFVDGNRQMGTDGNEIQDFGAFVYTGKPGKLKLTVLPAPSGSIMLTKTGAGTGEPVAGAAYELLAAEDLVSGNAVRVRSGAKVSEGTTGGGGTVSFYDLIPGKYEIREKKAAPGYLLDTGSYPCTVVRDQATNVQVKDCPDIKGKVSVEKLVKGTSLHLSDAEFTVYAWSEQTGSYSVSAEKLVYDAGTHRYRSGILRFTEDNMGKFRVRETKNPSGYTGSWYGDFVLEEPGTEKTFEFQAENAPAAVKKVEIRKIDRDTRMPLPGAEFTIYEYDQALGNYRQNGTLLSYDGNMELYSSEELSVTDHNMGRFLVRETRNPSGYEGTWERELNLSGGDAELQYTVENIPVKVPTGQAEIVKEDSLTGERLEGAEFVVYQWNSVSGTYEDTLGERAAVTFMSGEKKYRTDVLEITEENQGKFKILETKNPPGYTGTWEQEFELSGEDALVSLTAVNDPERLPVGSITVTKKILENEIIWAHGNPVFRFVAEGKDQRGCYRKYENFVRFSQEGYERDEGRYASAELTFPNIPLGTYKVYEKPVLRYFLQEVRADTVNVTVTSASEPGYGKLPGETAWGTAVLTMENRHAALTFVNKAGRCDGYSHSDVLKNTIPWGTGSDP